MREIHFADFQKYRCGTSIRTGPPWSRDSGRPSCAHTTQAFSPVTSASGRLVVYPVEDVASTNAAVGCGRAVASRVSTLTPSKLVASLDHVVTQWMSPSYRDGGNACAWSHVQVVGSSTRPSTLIDQRSGSIRGVTSAVSTG